MMSVRRRVVAPIVVAITLFLTMLGVGNAQGDTTLPEPTSTAVATTSPSGPVATTDKTSSTEQITPAGRKAQPLEYIAQLTATTGRCETVFFGLEGTFPITDYIIRDERGGDWYRLGVENHTYPGVDNRYRLWSIVNGSTEVYRSSVPIDIVACEDTTPTATPTATASPTTSPIVTATTTVTPTQTATVTATATQTATASPSATATASATATVTATATATASPTKTPSATNTVTTPSTSAPTSNPPSTYVPKKPYEVAGYHNLNGRKWFTTCEDYSQTVRCQTDIWSTQVELVKGKFVSKTGWHFNNLTYLPYMKRSQWATNPLGYTGSWTASDGRQWRTACDTPQTGGNGCRSEIRSTVVQATKLPNGSYSYEVRTMWVFNNMVLFS